MVQPKINKNLICRHIVIFQASGDGIGVHDDAEARHLEMKLLPLSMDELDWSRPYILRSLGLARSLVLGMLAMHSGMPSRSSRVDWRENSVVATVETLRGGESDRRNDQ